MFLLSLLFCQADRCLRCLLLPRDGILARFLRNLRACVCHSHIAGRKKEWAQLCCFRCVFVKSFDLAVERLSFFLFIPLSISSRIILLLTPTINSCLGVIYLHIRFDLLTEFQDVIEKINAFRSFYPQCSLWLRLPTTTSSISTSLAKFWICFSTSEQRGCFKLSL